MKCFIENFKELDIDELLAVNGGYGRSSKGGYGKGSGGSGSYGTVTTTSSSNQSSWDVWVANKDGRNSSGEITQPHDPYRNSQKTSGSYESTSFVPDNSTTGGGGKTSQEEESSVLPSDVGTGELNGSIEGFLENINSLVDGYYVYGGNDPEIDGGVDCSGSVLWAINQEGNDIYTNNELIEYVDADDVRPGDLRFLLDENGNACHVQVIIDAQGTRFNATGGPENTINNPGSLDILTTQLPESGVYWRLNFGD